MKIFGYGRASTAKQVASPATQKDAIADYCHRQGLPFQGHFFIDPSTSGKKPIWDRPAGSEMMKLLQRGDHVIVSRLDRLSRSFVSFARLLDQFERLGIVLHIVDMNGVLDPSNPQAMLTIHILVAFAEYERRLISIRTCEGLHSIVAAGGKLGPSAVYGKKIVKRWSASLGKHINVEVDNPEEVKVLNKILELRAAGYSCDAIRQYFSYELRIKRRDGKEWTTNSVQRAIYVALKRMAQSERVPGCKPAVLPDDLGAPREEESEAELYEPSDSPEDDFDEDDFEEEE